jgi:hypothetical protein
VREIDPKHCGAGAQQRRKHGPHHVGASRLGRLTGRCSPCVSSNRPDL